MIAAAPEIVEDLNWFSNRQDEVNLWLWGGVALAAVVVLTAWYIRRRRRKNGGKFFPPTPPHEKALKRLRDIRRWIRRDTQREFAERVSQIVREYIQERFGLRAPHRSTEEFLWEAGESSQLSDAERQLLRGFLGACDLVKFAQHRVDVPRMQALFHSAVSFVQGSAPKEDGAKPEGVS